MAAVGVGAPFPDEQQPFPIVVGDQIAAVRRDIVRQAAEFSVVGMGRCFGDGSVFGEKLAASGVRTGCVGETVVFLRPARRSERVDDMPPLTVVQGQSEPIAFLGIYPDSRS